MAALDLISFVLACCTRHSGTQHGKCGRTQSSLAEPNGFAMRRGDTIRDPDSVLAHHRRISSRPMLDRVQVDISNIRREPVSRQAFCLDIKAALLTIRQPTREEDDMQRVLVAAVFVISFSAAAAAQMPNVQQLLQGLTGIAPPSWTVDGLGRLRGHGEFLGALLLIVDGRLISDG